VFDSIAHPPLYQRKGASFLIASVITPRSPGRKSSSTPLRIRKSKSEAMFSHARQ
jgi:hypothetical protein